MKRNDSAFGVSGGIIVASVAIVVLLAAVLMIGQYSVGDNSTTATTTSTATATTTVTQQVMMGTSNASDGASTGINTQQIYTSSAPGIVTVAGAQVQSSILGQQSVDVLGSGFVALESGSYYIVTNFHVVDQTTNLTVTFSDGDAYAARVVGSDPYSDLAIVSVQGAPTTEYHPLQIASSSSLQVGDPIVAIGNPYGLSGSMTQGIISQLGRTIQDETAGNYSIANVIQFSAPINPGNSGGPLINSAGSVVGITTATESGSEGVGFAIPSDTILKEISPLIANGSYTQHSYLGIGALDMNYQLAQASGTNVTYGVLIENVVAGGPAAKAGIHAGSKVETINGQQYIIGGDILVSINGTKIVNNDALASYLSGRTVAGNVISIGIIRNGSSMTVSLTLGVRPALQSS